MKLFGIIFSLLLFCSGLNAQETEERRLIDLDRRHIQFASQEALEKSREYIRKDSTYYMGYMYWGAYLFNRANDVRGFQLAAVMLHKAFNLIEKDYDEQLRTRSNDLVTYLSVNTVQNDYTYIANWLEGSYQNIERADSAYNVLMHVKERDLQYEGAVDTWNTLAWIYHRNRMYTSEKFPFLLNTVHENDSMAYACLDSAIAKTNRDNEMNQGLFDPTFLNARYYYTYHYKVILFTYDFKLDSADYYYEALLSSGYYSSNNYANYQYMKGEFGVAQTFYKEAETRDATTDKHTREYFYMRGLLEINRGTPERSDSLLSRIINKDGFTPGYGWHTIALARALTYEGLTAESQEKVNNAARFEELHIGTTWGKEQYNLGVAMLNYVNTLHLEAQHYFENNQWYFWLNPVNWYKWAEYKIKVHHFRLILVSLVAANPERAEVLYPIFSSENIMGWDETWQMLDGMSNRFFIGYYRQLLENDPRPAMKNYFRFVLARLYISEGDKSSAEEYLNEIIGTDNEYWTAFDTLLKARTYEALAACNDDETEQQVWLGKAYSIYPQLLPFNDMALNFRVKVDGEVFVPDAGSHLYRIALFVMGLVLVLMGLYYTARRYFKFAHSPKWIVVGASSVFVLALVVWLNGVFNQDALSEKQQVLEQFSNCKIGFTDNVDSPYVELEFGEIDSLHVVIYSLYDAENKLVGHGQVTIDPDQPDRAGIQLAYRLFKIDYQFEELEEPVEDVPVEKADDSIPVISARGPQPI